MANHWYRTIIELSCMSNNEEYVVHELRDKPFNSQKEKLFKRTAFDVPSLVISRRVLDEEIKAGLRTSYRGLIFDCDGEKHEDAPKMTYVLDELHKLHNQLSISINEIGMSPAAAIVRLIELYFYDCMSSACSIYWLAAVRMIIERQNIPVETPLWSEGLTIKSFLDEIQNIDTFEKTANEICLPANCFQLELAK